MPRHQRCRNRITTSNLTPAHPTSTLAVACALTPAPAPAPGTGKAERRPRRIVPEPYELILGADLVYAATPLPTTKHLATALATALAKPHGVALVALEQRPDSTDERAAFLAALANVGLESVPLALAEAVTTELGPNACTSKVVVHRISFCAATFCAVTGEPEPEPEPS